MRRNIVAILAFLASGCSSSTGILPAGPDTYTIRANGYGSERSALLQASDSCIQKGREFLPNTMGPVGDARYPSGYTVTFRCLPAGDPAVKDVPAWTGGQYCGRNAEPIIFR